MALNCGLDVQVLTITNVANVRLLSLEIHSDLPVNLGILVPDSFIQLSHQENFKKNFTGLT